LINDVRLRIEDVKKNLKSSFNKTNEKLNIESSQVKKFEKELIEEGNKVGQSLFPQPVIIN